MQTALRRKTETGNEKDPSAALGMTKRGKVHLTLFFSPQRRLASFFAAKPPSLSLPPWGRGTASAVDRVLSLMAHLRRSPPLSFIPLVPYPARSARHLPHAGKALFRKYRYPHPTSAPSGHLLPEEGERMAFSRIVIAFSWKGIKHLLFLCKMICESSIIKHVWLRRRSE